MNTKLLKWLGCKIPILPTIESIIPESVDHYIEPFFGTGAVYLNLMVNRVSEAYISDLSYPIVNLFKVIEKYPENLIVCLGNLIDQVTPITPRYYYHIRDKYNSKDINCVEHAALFILINKYGFKGLYRENRSGLCNVPVSPDILSGKTIIFDYTEPIRNISAILANAPNKTLVRHSYTKVKPVIRKGSFLYLDPPYSGGYDGYTSSKFSQQQLKVFCDYCDAVGARFLQSNYDDEIVRSLYQGYNISAVKVPNKRISKVNKNEVLIYNY